MKRTEKVIRNWLYLGMVMVLIQVAIGGITRLTESGLSITEWKPVTGTLPPMNAAQWQEEFEAYKQSPEYLKVNAGFSLDQFKQIYWWEYIHRFWARLLGFVFIIPFLYFIAKKWLDTSMVLRLGIVLLLGAAQGFMGWIMVKSGLNDNPWVSPYRLTAHLFLALILFVYLFWLSLDLEKKPGTRTEERLNYILLWIATIFAVIQIFYGGMVAGSDAARMFNTYPTMDGQLLPNGIFDMKPIYLNFFENRITMQFMHRNVAILTILSIFFYSYRASRFTSLQIRQGISLLLITIFIQFALGVMTLLFSSPQQISVPFGVLHQSFAFLLSAILVYLHYQYRNNSKLI